MPALKSRQEMDSAIVAADSVGNHVRRTSARIAAKISTKKRGPRSKSPVEKKAKKKPKVNAASGGGGGVDEEGSNNANGSNSDDLSLVAADGVDNGNAHALVTETLRKFNKYHLHFVQEEEKRCVAHQKIAKNKKSNKSKKRGDLKVAKSKQKKGGKSSDVEESKKKRPDLKAMSRMQNENCTVHRQQRIGDIPGIDVGHKFLSRAEMVVVGLHNHWLSGIEYIAKPISKDVNRSLYKFPLTVSIVLSGQYEDDLDNFEEIVYTGQGGNDLLRDKRQNRHQVLKRGNLGLKHSMDYSVPVRVIRGREDSNSYVGKVYTYDGLYQVVKYWKEKGLSGFTVYRFRLKRREGQPPLLKDDRIQFSRREVPKLTSGLQGLICEDITGGQEDIPIPVTNRVDDSPMPPQGFTYIKEMKIDDKVDDPMIAPMGCKCEGVCSDSKSCACAKFNGGDFPYVPKNGGRLMEPKSVVFECGPHCGCGPQCVNKTSQRPKYRLEIFRTEKKGWGVRSWDLIPAGAPVCEYIGLMKKTVDLDRAAENSYVLDIDCLQTMKGLDGRESRLGDVSLPSHVQKHLPENIPENVPFCIDAGQTGNVTRFINHSCEPNLFVQCMLSKHHDPYQARVVLVAADNIPPLKELTYDYAYPIDSVVGPDGEIRALPCYCGAKGCRKRLY